VIMSPKTCTLIWALASCPFTALEQGSLLGAEEVVLAGCAEICLPSFHVEVAQAVNGAFASQ